MDDEMQMSRVYIKTDSQARIVQIEGEYTLSNIVDIKDWVLIEEGAPCDRLNLAQSQYFPNGLYTADGIPRYKLVDGHPVERTDEEIDADRVPILEAQIREQRNKLLSESDWTQIPDNPLSQSERESWATYRQQLRDIPEQTGFPTNITWPERWS